MTHNPNHTE